MSSNEPTSVVALRAALLRTVTERNEARARCIDLEADLQVARKRILELEDESVTVKRQRGW